MLLLVWQPAPLSPPLNAAIGPLASSNIRSAICLNTTIPFPKLVLPFAPSRLRETPLYPTNNPLISPTFSRSNPTSPRVSMFNRINGSVFELRKLKRHSPKSADNPSV